MGDFSLGPGDAYAGRDDARDDDYEVRCHDCGLLVMEVDDAHRCPRCAQQNDEKEIAKEDES